MFQKFCHTDHVFLAVCSSLFRFSGMKAFLASGTAKFVKTLNQCKYLISRTTLLLSTPTNDLYYTLAIQNGYDRSVDQVVVKRRLNVNVVLIFLLKHAASSVPFIFPFYGLLEEPLKYS